MARRSSFNALQNRSAVTVRSRATVPPELVAEFEFVEWTLDRRRCVWILHQQIVGRSLVPLLLHLGMQPGGIGRRRAPDCLGPRVRVHVVQTIPDSV